MTTDESETATENQLRSGFRVSAAPSVRSTFTDTVAAGFESPELPRFSGPPAVFAIARDAHTIFVYWNVDWPTVFEGTGRAERKVYLRALTEGTQETEAAVEAMAANHFLTVSRPGATYTVELGYRDAMQAWKSIAISNEVSTPPDAVSDNVKDVELATVPLHLSFQRMVDFFRKSNGEALVDSIAKLQRSAVEAPGLLTEEENEILHAMNVDLAEHGKRMAVNEDAARKRMEAVLGFGSSSPVGGVGGSSWGGSSRSA